jgi:hypothetical protein
MIGMKERKLIGFIQKVHSTSTLLNGEFERMRTKKACKIKKRKVWCGFFFMNGKNLCVLYALDKASSKAQILEKKL